MTLITFTSPTNELTQTAVSWEVALTLARMGRRVLYLPFGPDAQVDWIDTKIATLCRQSIEVRRAFLRTNLAIARGSKITWPDNIHLMKLIRAGRRSKAVVILAGHRDEDEFPTLCLSSDLVVMCVRPTPFDVGCAEKLGRRFAGIAPRLQIGTKHVYALLCHFEAYAGELVLTRPKGNSRWLGNHLPAPRTKFVAERLASHAGANGNAKQAKLDLFAGLTAEILVAAGEGGKNLKAGADGSYFSHVALLREEFRHMPMADYGRLAVPQFAVTEGR